MISQLITLEQEQAQQQNCQITKKLLDLNKLVHKKRREQVGSPRLNEVQQSLIEKQQRHNELQNKNTSQRTSPRNSIQKQADITEKAQINETQNPETQSTYYGLQVLTTKSNQNHLNKRSVVMGHPLLNSPVSATHRRSIGFGTLGLKLSTGLSAIEDASPLVTQRLQAKYPSPRTSTFQVIQDQVNGSNQINSTKTGSRITSSPFKQVLHIIPEGNIEKNKTQKFDDQDNFTEQICLIENFSDIADQKLPEVNFRKKLQSLEKKIYLHVQPMKIQERMDQYNNILNQSQQTFTQKLPSLVNQRDNNLTTNEKKGSINIQDQGYNMQAIIVNETGIQQEPQIVQNTKGEKLKKQKIRFKNQSHLQNNRSKIVMREQIQLHQDLERQRIQSLLRNNYYGNNFSFINTPVKGAQSMLKKSLHKQLKTRFPLQDMVLDDEDFMRRMKLRREDIQGLEKSLQVHKYYDKEIQRIRGSGGREIEERKNKFITGHRHSLSPSKNYQTLEVDSIQNNFQSSQKQLEPYTFSGNGMVSSQGDLNESRGRNILKQINYATANISNTIGGPNNKYFGMIRASVDDAIFRNENIQELTF
eukprot:403371275